MAYRPYDTGEISEVDPGNRWGPPQSAGEPAKELASPGVRLVAWIIDSLIYLVIIIIPVTVFAIDLYGVSDATFDDGVGVSLLAISMIFLPPLALLAVFIVQMVLLAARGQTIGKILMKIRIVDAQTGEHPGWARLVLRRTSLNWFVFGVLNATGVGGMVYMLVDSLFIFRSDHRTIHDLIAGTRVDKVAD